MKKQKTKKNKEKSYRLWKFCVASDERQTENLEQASAFLLKIFTATLRAPFKLLNTSEEEAKGLQLNTQRSRERSVAAIANNNRNTEKQICRRAKPKGGRLARSLLFFPAHLPRTTPSTFLSCWIGIGSTDLSFYNPLPLSRGQGFRQVSEAVLGLSVSRGGSFPVKLKPLNNYSVGA